MTEQGSRPATPTPSPGEPYSPGPHLPSAVGENFSSPAFSKGSQFLEGPVFVDGTRSVAAKISEGAVSGDGSHRLRQMERDVAELSMIDAAGLSDDQEFTAQLMWAIRNMSRALAESGKRPFHEWTVEEIIAFASKAAPR